MGKSSKWIFVLIGAFLAIGALFLPWVATTSLGGSSQYPAIEVVKTSFLEGGALIYSGVAIILGALFMLIVLILSLTSMRTYVGADYRTTPIIILSLLSAAGFFAGLFLMKSYYAKVNVLQEINYQVGPAFGYYLSFAGIAIVLLSVFSTSSKRPS